MPACVRMRESGYDSAKHFVWSSPRQGYLEEVLLKQTTVITDRSILYYMLCDY